MNTAIILAAGKSSRMGSDTPKQYLKINEKLVIDYSIDAFQDCDIIDDIIIVVEKEYIDKVKDLYPKLNIIQGGACRKESSFLVLKACSPLTKNVIIHDAARIFINKSLILNCINTLLNADGATIATLMTDTLARFKNNFITNMEEREKLISIQTPQAFNYKKILLAHEKFSGEATDDIRIMLESGYNCQFIISDNQNFKLTTKSDYENSIKILGKNR